MWQRRHSSCTASPAAAVSFCSCARKYGSRNEFAIIVACHVVYGEALAVLAGDALVARVDVKAERDAGVVRVVGCHHERTQRSGAARPVDVDAVSSAFARFAGHVGLEPVTASG